MKREFNFVPDPEDNDDYDGDAEFVSDYFDSDGENCPYLDILASIAMNDKPFGFLWPKEKVREFLKARRYKILVRKDKDTGEEYEVAVKSDSGSIPNDRRGNMKETFDSEMQDIILKWVLRIARENEVSDENNDSAES